MQNLENLNVQAISLKDAATITGGGPVKNFFKKVGNFLGCVVESIKAVQ